MKKVSIKGVIVGSVTDIISTNILMIPLAIYIIKNYDILNLPPSDVQRAFSDILKNDVHIKYIKITIGLFCTAFGGYIAARISKHNEALNGALSSFLCVGFGFYSLVFGNLSGNYFQHILLLLLTPVLAALGGYLRFKQVNDNA